MNLTKILSLLEEVEEDLHRVDGGACLPACGTIREIRQELLTDMLVEIFSTEEP